MQVNVLIDRNANNKALITDFGLSVFAGGFSRNYYSLRSGNVRWVAPELMGPTLLEMQSGKTVPDDSGTIKSSRPTMRGDVYSFACVCVEV